MGSVQPGLKRTVSRSVMALQGRFIGRPALLTR
jgi:hypothetical protein